MIAARPSALVARRSTPAIPRHTAPCVIARSPSACSIDVVQDLLDGELARGLQVGAGRRALRRRSRRRRRPGSHGLAAARIDPENQHRGRPAYQGLCCAPRLRRSPLATLPSTCPPRPRPAASCRARRGARRVLGGARGQRPGARRPGPGRGASRSPRAVGHPHDADLAGGDRDDGRRRQSDGGFNTLLVQVRGRGDAYFQQGARTAAAAARRASRHFDPLGDVDRRGARGGPARPRLDQREPGRRARPTCPRRASTSSIAIPNG